MSVTDLLKPFSDFDREIKGDITKDLSPKKREQLSKKLSDEYSKWQTLYLQKSREQGVLTRRINKALSEGSMSYSDLEIINQERAKIISVKNSIRETREKVRKQANDILFDKEITVQSHKTVKVQKSKILSAEKPGLPLLRQQIRFIKKDIEKLEQETDVLDVLAGEQRLKQLKIIYLKYVVNLEAYINDKDFEEVLEEDEGVYEDLIEFLRDKDAKKYPLQWYATPNTITIY